MVWKKELGKWVLSESPFIKSMLKENQELVFLNEICLDLFFTSYDSIRKEIKGFDGIHTKIQINSLMVHTTTDQFKQI